MDERTSLALERLNDVRAGLNLEPLDDFEPGDHHAYSCPIARSLAKGVDFDSLTSVYEVMFLRNVENNEYVLGMTTPLEILRWIQAFDDGQYPEYEV